MARKAKIALQKKMEREGGAASTAGPSPSHGAGAPALPSPGTPTSRSGNNNGNDSTSARRAEQREAIEKEVEEKLGEWRRKRARAEAGLPEDAGGPDHHNSNGRNNHGRSKTVVRRLPGLYPTAYYGSLGNGGGSGSGNGGGGGCWPEVYKAPIRRAMPGPARANGKPLSSVSNKGKGDHHPRFKEDEDETKREAEEQWEAPWMLGLVDRSRTGKASAPSRPPLGEGGPGEPVDLVSSGDEDPNKDGRKDIGLRAASEGRIAPEAAAAAARGGGGASGDRGVRDYKGAAAGAGGAEGEDGLSDLHHEIKAFEKYVSLTPAEVGTGCSRVER